MTIAIGVIAILGFAVGGYFFLKSKKDASGDSIGGGPSKPVDPTKK